MAFNSNGQISYLVLDSLSSGSKYGLEIIEFISQKSGGNYIMKKPTLYSCLTRMEKKGLVSSSYWGESEFGGKRHYYTITNQGREYLDTLSKEFENFSFDEPDSNDTVVESVNEAVSTTQTAEDSPVFLQQGNIFDMVKEDKTTQIQQEEADNENDIIENQMDIFNMPPIEQHSHEEETKSALQPNDEKLEYYQAKLEQELAKDDAKFLDESEKTELTPFETEQNQRLYDTSTELKKYRKRKSFSENQIEMSVVYEKAEDEEIQRARIEELKKSMLNLRQNNQENFTPSHSPIETQATSPEEMFYVKNEPTQVSVETSEEEPKDDAIFITGPRMSEIPVQKKITPPNIEVNIYDDNLPAPKRNTNLEPTYKDMMAKLFEHKKEKSTKSEISQPEIVEEASVQASSFADYGTLKKYYQTHGIEFKEYKKSSVERNHNTNFLQFINSAILLLLSGVGCAVLFGIINAVNQLKTGTNFMFYTLPILFLVYFVYTLVKYKVYPSKKPVLIYNSIINWAVFLLASLVVFIINIICGMQYETMINYLTSIIVPIFGLLIAFPINYYIKKFIYKKFGK